MPPTGESQMSYKISLRFALACSIAPLALVTSQANAQSGDNISSDSDGPSDEVHAEGGVIIVTAQKRSQDLQDVPIAITAISGVSLREGGIDDLQSLQTLVPGLQVGESFGTARVNIRGISNENLTIGGDPGVALHFNGVYAARPEAALGSFFDLAQVEVLRGPQGTLYGRNATGGSVNVVYALPTAKREGYAFLEIANFGTVITEAALGGQISDELLARVSARYARSDGFTKNLAPGFGDLDDRGEFAFRGQLLWEPNELLSSHLTLNLAEQDKNGPSQKVLGNVRGRPLPWQIDGGILPAPDRYEVFSDAGAFDRRQSFSVTLENRLDLGFADLVSLTDYRELDIDFRYDVDTTSLANAAETSFATTSKQFSSELRLQGSSSSVEWIAGAYFLDEKADQRILVRFGPYSAAANPLSTPAFGFPFPETVVDLGGEVSTTSFAIFGQADWRVAEALVLTLGLRHTWDDRTGGEFNNQLLTPVTGPRRLIAANFSETSGKLGIQYFFTDDINGYVTISRGFKSGGLNIGTLQDPFGSEVVWAYEGGFKSLLAGGAVRLNLASFLYQYEDLQVQQIEGFTTVIRNAADATVKGVEAELGIRPLNGLTIDASFTWLDSSFENFSSFEEAFPELGVQDLSGNRLSNTPEFTARIAAQYETSLTEELAISFGGSIYWQDDVFYSQFNRPNVGQEAYARLDLSAKLRHLPSGVDVIAFAENVTDRFVVDNITVTAALTGSGLQASLAPPRSYGIRIHKSF